MLGLALLSLAGILVFSSEAFNHVHIAYLMAPVSILSVSAVFVGVSFVMYKSVKNTLITTLKRRGGRVYGELLHHKMRLMDVMDGKITFVDIEKYLYPQDAFSKIKKFLYEEYFLNSSFDPFFKQTKAFEHVTSFYSLHKELETFMRSQNYDIIEYNKFKVLYSKVYRQPIVDDTPEENFNHPDLVEAMETYKADLDYALLNVDSLMAFLDEHLKELDTSFAAGVPWSVTKVHFDHEFQLWIHANS